ncbi:hypothetical protein [Shewanella xiamenensis]|uniref:Uncharacterized protein n=1 Tax=Shewanella xiamenensis TaxID=332186 RepID=A0ABT6UBK9_9GAMM|nr:hypothetical protein [Shewanella xiamenensis]MDI5830684.1 hypothetical protein [Shewanella xiamenensis]
MDFTIDMLTKLIGVIFGIPAAIIPIYYKFHEVRDKKKKDLSERYAQIKELLTDIDANFPQICVILSEITTARLTKEEVVWFINELHAFGRLALYGQCKRFLKIDLLYGEFVLSEKYSTWGKRFFECFKVAVTLLVFTIFSGVVLYVFVGRINPLGLNIAIIIWLSLFIFMIWIFSDFLSSLDSAKKLCGKP